MTGDKWKALITGLSDKELRSKFPAELRHHRSVKARGAQGLQVVDPELQSFRGFMIAMKGPKPGLRWSVDRIDNLDIYRAGNVRWADPSQQANNRSTTRLIYARGEVHSITTWARKRGISPDTIRKRLDRGYSHEDAVFGKKRGRRAETSPTPMEVSPLERHTSAFASWERYYEAWWRSGITKAGATRAVFASWITGNNVVALMAELEKTHQRPFSFSPRQAAEADPDLMLDVRYLRLLEQLELHEEANRSLRSTQEQIYVRALRRALPNVLLPSKAAEAARRMSKGG